MSMLILIPVTFSLKGNLSVCLYLSSNIPREVFQIRAGKVLGGGGCHWTSWLDIHNLMYMLDLIPSVLTGAIASILSLWISLSVLTLLSCSIPKYLDLGGKEFYGAIIWHHSQPVMVSTWVKLLWLDTQKLTNWTFFMDSVVLGVSVFRGWGQISWWLHQYY